MTSEELVLSLPQPIAVVGNGMIRDRRDEIEVHATIIRLNNWITDGFEPHVGCRTDVWCTNCHSNVARREWNKPMFTVVNGREASELDVWQRRYPQMATPAESWLKKAWMLKPNAVSGPSSGIALLHFLYLARARFTAFGFDGLRSGHYWSPGDLHTHGDELGAILELVRLGVAIR